MRRVLSLLLALCLLAVLSMPMRAHAAVADWQQGASIVPTTPTDFSSPSFQQSVNNLAATGANYVTLIIPYYQTDLYSTDIQPGKNTPTDASVTSAIQYAHSKGMHVMLKFHLETKGNLWRANIDPADRATWFSRYGDMLVHYAQLSTPLGLEEMCLGVEMYHMTSNKANPTNGANWKAMISRVRAAFPGQLTYSAQRPGGYYDEINQTDFWPMLDTIGISAYYPLGTKGTDTIATMKKYWNDANVKYIAPVYQKYKKPIQLAEVGYRSVSGSNLDPFAYNRTAAYDPNVQARAYDALFSYWNDYSYIQGIHLWEWSSNPNAGGPGDPGYTPQHKAAQNIMTKWFGGTAYWANLTANATPNPVNRGQNVTINVRASCWVLQQDQIIDVEVFDANGQRVLQKVYEHVNYSGAQPFSTNISYVPTTPGTYYVSVGVFTANWASQLQWSHSLTKFTVN